MNNFLNISKYQLKKFLNNVYILPLLTVFLAMYSPRLSPKLPNFIKDLFQNSFFNFFIILIIIYLSNKNLQISFIISLTFLLIISLVNLQEVKDTIEKLTLVENFAQKLNMKELNKLDIKELEKISKENGIHNLKENIKQMIILEIIKKQTELDNDNSSDKNETENEIKDQYEDEYEDEVVEAVEAETKTKNESNKNNVKYKNKNIYMSKEINKENINKEIKTGITPITTNNNISRVKSEHLNNTKSGQSLVARQLEVKNNINKNNIEIKGRGTDEEIKIARRVKENLENINLF